MHAVNNASHLKGSSQRLPWKPLKRRGQLALYMKGICSLQSYRFSSSRAHYDFGEINGLKNVQKVVGNTKKSGKKKLLSLRLEKDKAKACGLSARFEQIICAQK